MRANIFFMLFLAFSRIVCAEIIEEKSLAISSQDELKFKNFPSIVYLGEINFPKDFTKNYDDIWRDSYGKKIEKPHINFSGKYFISLHSCGAGCRYYRLTDLSTGKEISSLEMFASTDPPPMTRDGFRYITSLIYKADSNMLVAQYEVQKNDEFECRERIFIFGDNEKIKPISETKYHCNSWGSE